MGEEGTGRQGKGGGERPYRLTHPLSQITVERPRAIWANYGMNTLHNGF